MTGQVSAANGSERLVRGELRKVSHRVIAAVALAFVLLAFPAVTIAARAPSDRERIAITRALAAYARSVPAGCVYFNIRVSSSSTYARVDPTYLIPLPPSRSDPCLRYAANGSGGVQLRRLPLSPPCVGSDALARPC
jgi:hypothetical protein